MPKARPSEIAEASLDEHAVRIHKANEKARGNFVEWITTVGGELKAAQDKMAGSCDGFQKWASEQFGYSKSRVYQLIDAAVVMQRLSTNVDNRISLPSNEAQCRALATIKPKQQPKAWAEAFEAAQEHGREPTAAMIKRHAPGSKAAAKAAADIDADAWLEKACELFSRFVEHCPDRAAEACSRMRSLMLMTDADAPFAVIDAVPADEPSHEQRRAAS